MLTGATGMTLTRIDEGDGATKESVDRRNRTTWAARPGAVAPTQSVAPPSSAKPDIARPEIGGRAAQVARGGRYRGGLKLLRRMAQLKKRGRGAN